MDVRSYRPAAIATGGSGAAGALVYAAAQRFLAEPSALTAISTAGVALECLHDSLGEAEASALARALIDRVPQAVIVFCAAAAGSNWLPPSARSRASRAV